YTGGESGDYRVGALRLASAGVNRYGLLEQFNNVSTTGGGNPPGTVDFLPFGKPYVVGESPVAPTGNENENPGQLFGSVYPGQAVAQVLDGSAISAAASLEPYVVLGDALYQQACFAADTPLLTPMGSKPIGQFRVGDLLLSRSESDPEGPTEIKQVEQVFVRTGWIMNLRAGGQLIRTTAEHPFFVRGKGWLPGSDLQAGDLLSSHDGRWIPVE